MSVARARLKALLAPAVLEAIEEFVTERVRAEIAELDGAETPWLSVADAAEYPC